VRSTMEASLMSQRRALQQLFRSRPAQQSFRQLHQTTRQQFRTRPPSTGVFAANATRTPKRSFLPFTRAFRGQQTRNFSFRRWNSTAAPQQESLSLSQRLKKLSREYGWAALGVYLALTALDLPFCFLAVRMIGPDKVGHWEHVIVSYIKELIKWPASDQAGEEVKEGAIHGVEKVAKPVEEVTGQSQRILEEDEAYVVADHGYKDAEKANSGADASKYIADHDVNQRQHGTGLWTQLALAYALHKTFIFVRVPLTAAITPKIVKTLRSWGWNIGKMPKKGVASSSKTGVNTKGSGVKPDD
jgi:N-terminal acetyltransferase 2